MSAHIKLRDIRKRRLKLDIKKKTRKSYAKRFKETGTGLILATQAGRRHNLSNRTKRSLLGGKGFTVANASLVKLVRYSLGLKHPKVSNCTYESKVKSQPVSKIIQKLCIK